MVPLDGLTTDDSPSARERSGDLQNKLNEMERSQILRALEQSNWVVAGPNGAAARLGIKRTTLAGRMQKLGIRLVRKPAPESGTLTPSISKPEARVLEWPVPDSARVEAEHDRWQPAFA